MPVRWSWVRAGRELKNVRRNDINLPRFRKTEPDKIHSLLNDIDTWLTLSETKV